MIQTTYLSARDQATVDAKLAELQEKSGGTWACEVTRQQQLGDAGYLLEVTINGQIKKPVALSSDKSVDCICKELDRLFQTLN